MSAAKWDAIVVDGWRCRRCGFWIADAAMDDDMSVACESCDRAQSAWDEYNSTIAKMREERDEYRSAIAELGDPIADDFFSGVRREAMFQRAKWGRKHDSKKSDAEWFWLLGFLASKAMRTLETGEGIEKLRHRLIAAAAVLANWHAARAEFIEPDDGDSNLAEWQENATPAPRRQR